MYLNEQALDALAGAGPLPEQFPTRFVLHLRDLGGDTPTAIRVRHALKRLLRDYRLRCESIRPAGPQK